MALAFSGLVAMPAAAAQEDEEALQLCLMIFPNGISGTEAATAALANSGLDPAEIDEILAAAGSGPITCYDIFGGAPPTEEPTQPPTQEPTQPPTQEPTQPPTQPATEVPTKEPTKATGGKTAPTVTTMPTTGHGSDGGSGAPAALYAALATVLTLVAAVALRLTGARDTRR
jgi:hypothetical protein